MKKILTMLFVLALPLASSGCIAVGRTSSGGWFVWPGLGTIIVLLLIVWLIRRR